MSFPYLGETRILDDAIRSGLGGAFISLEDGVTHYEFGGPEPGAPVVFIHGFSVPYFIFDTTFEFLKGAGFRVLRYDLFGRGYSDRPIVRYDMELFIHQLKGLLDAFNLGAVNLIGLSMGGSIVATFTNRYPERVSKLVLIDPSGARPIDFSPLLKLVKMPLFGELVLGLFGTRNMLQGIASDLFSPELVEQFQAQYRVQMEFKGFKRAIISSMRANVLGSFLESYAELGRLNIPTLMFWGVNDKTVPFEQSADILAAIPHAEFHPIEACGHIPHYEKPSEVNPILLEFLKTP